jgi:hypothetical protein
MAAALIVAGMFLTGGLAAVSASAYEVPPPAYQLATHRTGVPAEVLYALALQESGTALRGQLIPWPWTLNVAGKPYRFSRRETACSALLQAIRDVGTKAVDVGLGQINIGWNGERFLQPCEALDPYRNLAVATALLREHKTAENDWVTAAGRYHRPAGGVPAARYRKSFAQHLSRITRLSLQGPKTP